MTVTDRVCADRVTVPAVLSTVPAEAEAMLPDERVFIQRIRRGGKILDATSETTIQAGDIVAVAGRRDVRST